MTDGSTYNQRNRTVIGPQYSVAGNAIISIASHTLILHQIPMPPLDFTDNGKIQTSVLSIIKCRKA